VKDSQNPFGSEVINFGLFIGNVVPLASTPTHRFVLSSALTGDLLEKWKNGKGCLEMWDGEQCNRTGGRHRCTRGASSTERAQSVYSATMDSSTV